MSLPESPDARFRALLDVAHALSTTLDVDELLRLVMARITGLLGCERSSLFLVDSARGEIWSKVAEGAENREIRLPTGRGLAGFVAETGRAVNVKDAYSDPRFHAEIDRATGFQTSSLLAVPLRGRDGKIIGVAEALNKRGGGAFTVDDERTLASMSSLVGVALENAQLYSAVRAKNQELVATQDKLRQKAAEVDLLFEIEREISSAPDLDAMIDGILGRALVIFESDAGSVALFDDAGHQLHVKRGGSRAEVKPLATAPRDGAAGRALEAMRPVAEADRLAAPLVVQGRDATRLLGVLELADRPGRPFAAEDEKLAALVAAQIARAVSVARSRAESARQQRLAALGQALSGVVHDLRTPMTVMTGYAELLVDADERATRSEYSAEILRQLDHVEAMIREVLAFVRGERQLLARKIFVHELWRDLSRTLTRELADKRIALEIAVDYGGAAKLDDAKLRRLATNLARNAAQAMDPGGRFRIGCSREGDALVLSFADTGPGIPPPVAARLFTAFNSHGKADGTGLGLAIVKEVVEAHGGDIAFRTAPGEGTTFTVRLPGAVVD